MTDSPLKEILIKDAEPNATARIPFSLPSELPKTAGFVYFDCLALEDECEIHGGQWESSDPAPFDVHVGIGICTYKREEYVTRNIEVIRKSLLDNPESAAYGRLGVYVVDNGQTLKGQIEESGDIFLFYNKNYGGSGGFTRALMEIGFHANEYTHILLMDDDILLEPQVIEKTLSFLSYRKPEYNDMHVGGAMLSIEKPCEQFEMGARFDDDARSRRRWSVDAINRLIDNDRAEDSNFNGWYYLCMPRNVVRKDNLPLPVFIKADDIEYGLRNIRPESLLLANGIGVWHAQYSVKYSTHLIYFIVRNKMIVRALHGSTYTAASCAEKIQKDVQSLLRRQRYDSALFTIEAMEDFLKGVDFFLEQEEDKKLAELMAQKTTHFKTPDELREMGFVIDPDLKPPRKKKRSFVEKGVTRLTLNGTSLGNAFAKKGYAFVDYFDCKPYQFSGYKKALQWDFRTGSGAITEYDREKFYAISIRLTKVCNQIRRKWDRACAEYRDRIHEITSSHYWFNHLGLNDSGYITNGRREG